MYIDAIHDREQDRILISERVDGKRVLRSELPEYVFYYTHPQGTHRSIFDDSLKKFTTHNIKKFHSELREKKADKNTKVFESDINSVFRYLADNYAGTKIPEINVGFFDIEVDFDAERGFAPPSDPFSPVTAISLYSTLTKILHTLVLCPPTLTFVEGSKLAEKYTNTELFSDEIKMLDRYLTLADDIDLFTGWNCLPDTSNVWLKDRIIKLGNVTARNMTNNHGKVIKYHSSGIKQVNRIILDNGYVIEASGEHVIPVMSKNKNSYKYPSSLIRTTEDKSVFEIKDMLEKDINCYMEISLRNNTNVDLTWRKIFEDHLELFFENKDFDIVIDDALTKKKVKMQLEADGNFKTKFPYSRLFSSSKDYTKVWCSRNFPFLTIKDKLDHIKSQQSIIIKYSNNNRVSIDLDKVLSESDCHMFGLMYTDGTFDRKAKHFSIYGSDEVLMTKVREVILKDTPNVHLANKPLRRGKDNCINLRFRRGSTLGVFASLALYTGDYKKKLNVEVLSKFSGKQFSAFFAGLVDGDGCVQKNSITVCNFNNDIAAMQELLYWNGVYASSSKNVVAVHGSQANMSFIQQLKLWHSKSSKISNLRIHPTTNSPSKDLRRFILKDKVIIRVASIETTNEFAAMSDIQTEGSYFESHGVRVHNSSGFDVPYLVNRVKLLMGADATRRFCLWDKEPTLREFIKFGRVNKTYEFVGRVHIDYLLLYQKHNVQQQHSYRLDFIGEIEVGDHKTPYEGTLDQLYKEDFSKFIEYNRQDVMLMVKIDDKRKFIGLANQIAHDNCILFKTTMGTVAFVEQAIINEMHTMGYVVPDRKPRDDDGTDEEEEEQTPVVGAYVATPKTGLHSHVGAVDINSLYPSTIRALNMSPETIIGQVLLTETMAFIDQRIASGIKRAEAWEGVFATLEYEHMMAQDDAEVTVEFENGKTWKTTGAGLYNYVFDPKNKVCISANGTLFRTDKDGMIPKLLGVWYTQRQALQAKVKEYRKKSKATSDPIEQGEYNRQAEYYDQLQYSCKIRLNALYGALLQRFCRFYDERLGQSTTLSGRSIVKHMNAKVNEIITGKYDFCGDAIIYADTDSNLSTTLHHTNIGQIDAESLFNACNIKWSVGDKEYACDDKLKVLSYNPSNSEPIYKNFNYMYRHKVSKAKWKITDSLGNEIIVTNDHSIMVERNNILIDVKPADIIASDIIISII